MSNKPRIQCEYGNQDSSPAADIDRLQRVGGDVQTDPDCPIHGSDVPDAARPINPRCANPICEHYLDEHRDGFRGCCHVYDQPFGPAHCPCCEFVSPDSAAQDRMLAAENARLIRESVADFHSTEDQLAEKDAEISRLRKLLIEKARPMDFELSRLIYDRAQTWIRGLEKELTTAKKLQAKSEDLGEEE